jgi:hypothetical protein
MELKREMAELTNNGQMLNKFRATETYDRMMQHPREEGGANNGDLIRLLFGKDSVFNVVRDFVNGDYEKGQAVELFQQETGIILKRFSTIKGFYDVLFAELVKIVESIYSINQETEEKVKEVMEVAEKKEDVGVEAFEITTVKLGKDSPEEVEGGRKIKITIEREGKRKDHIIVIDRLKESLRVTCPTFDLPSGKNKYIEIMPDEEYVIGMASRREIERRLLVHGKEEEKAIAAKNRGAHYKIISTESAEYKRFCKLEADAKAEAKRLLNEIKALKTNPLFHWFDVEKSDDIGSDQLIIGLNEDGIITVTDDGEKGATVLEIEK